ncbi:MAG: histidinol-phosphatase, partial [Actinomycetota bacterium]|nr:histidinol-phosphatase [Actinomycetota bacterium]
MNEPTGDLALALTIADTADRITMLRAGAADLRVEAKPDRTPVSDADLAVEDAIRAVLAARRPQDAVIGEERGGDPSADAGRAWLLDPIDGTKNFLRGVPVWATLIALVEEGEPAIGVISAPALRRRWWAATGVGAH